MHSLDIIITRNLKASGRAIAHERNDLGPWGTEEPDIVKNLIHDLDTEPVYAGIGRYQAYGATLDAFVDARKHEG